MAIEISASGGFYSFPMSGLIALKLDKLILKER